MKCTEIRFYPRFSVLDGAETCPENEKVRITQMPFCNANMSIYVISLAMYASSKLNTQARSIGTVHVNKFIVR